MINPGKSMPNSKIFGSAEKPDKLSGLFYLSTGDGETKSYETLTTGPKLDTGYVWISRHKVI